MVANRKKILLMGCASIVSVSACGADTPAPAAPAAQQTNPPSIDTREVNATATAEIVSTLPPSSLAADTAEAEVAAAAIEPKDVKTIAIRRDESGNATWWATYWTPIADDRMLLCVGTPNGATCSPEDTGFGDDNSVHVSRVGGDPNEIVLVLEPTAATVSAIADGAIKLDLVVVDPGVPSGRRLALTDLPPAAKSIALSVTDANGLVLTADVPVLNIETPPFDDVRPAPMNTRSYPWLPVELASKSD